MIKVSQEGIHDYPKLMSSGDLISIFLDDSTRFCLCLDRVVCGGNNPDVCHIRNWSTFKGSYTIDQYRLCESQSSGLVVIRDRFWGSGVVLVADSIHSVGDVIAGIGHFKPYTGGNITISNE